MTYPEMCTKVPWSLVKSGFKKGPRFSSLNQDTATYSSATSKAR